MKIRYFKHLKCRAPYNRRMNWDEPRGMRRVLVWNKESRRKAARRRNTKSPAFAAPYGVSPQSTPEDFFKGYGAGPRLTACLVRDSNGNIPMGRGRL